MDHREIAVVRALLGSKPRPVGSAERRQRLDDVGSIWPTADGVELEPVDIDGLPAEWSSVGDSVGRRAFMFFHGGGYCWFDRQPPRHGHRGRSCR